MNKKLTFTPQAEEANKGYKQLVEYCLDTIQRIEDSEYRKNTIAEIKKSNEIYDQVEKKATEPWDGASNSVLPLMTISCDNLEPRVVASLVGKKPFIRCEIENDQPKDQPTEILESFFNQELEDVVEIEKFTGEMVNQIMREGTIFAMPSYNLKERQSRDFLFVEDYMAQPEIQAQIKQLEMAAQQMLATNPERAESVNMAMQQEIQAMIPPNIGGVLIDPETGEAMYKDTVNTVFEGVRVDLLQFTDVLIPDDVDDIEEAPIFRKIRPTYAELVRDSQTKAGFIQKNVGPWLCDEKTDFGINDEAKTPVQKINNVSVNAKQVIECYECYVDYIAKKDDQEDEKELKDYTEQRFLVQITKDSHIILRVIPLNEISFSNRHIITRVRLFPKKGKSYGTSIYGKIKSIQEGATKTFNTAINVAEVTMIPWFMFTESTGLQNYTDGIRLSAGKGIKVDSIEGLYFPRFSINPDQILKWIDLWVSFWERLISIGDLQVGRESNSNTTATTTMAVIQEGNIKHNYQASSIRNDFLNIIRTIYDMYYQYMPLDKTFLWNGQQVQINRSQMTRKIKFRLTGSSDLSNKLIERKEKETFYQITAADVNINPLKRAEELVKSYGHTDVTDWISPNIAAIVNMVTQTPGADKIVIDALNQAQAQMAAQEQAAMQQGQPQ